MLFRNCSVTEILAEMRVKTPYVCMTFALVFVCLSARTANAQASRIKGYAVQVAALSSQSSADELVKGLNTRGLNAYWVKGASMSPVHRVRIGNFPTIASAHTYAEKLLGTGLLEAYAIAAYEPPAKGTYIANGKVHSFAQKYQGRQFNADAIDMVAAIGTRGWLLLSSKSIDLTLRQGRQGTQITSPLNLELAKLAAFVGSRGWGMSNNITKLLTPAVPANVASLASSRNWSIGGGSQASAAIAANNAPPVNVPTNIQSPAAASVATSISTPAPVTSIVSTPAPSASNFPAPTIPVSNSNTMVASAPEIRRGSLSPATSTGVRTTGSRGLGPAPRLQGSLELRDGRMWMTLRNTDSDRPFTGLARVTLSDDKSSQDVAPLPITLEPDKEASFPVDEAKFKDGSWMLMVFDQNGAARLIRGASFPGPPNQDQAQGAQKTPNKPAGSAPAEDTAQGPPSYVTGNYDATSTGGWVMQQAPQGQETAAQTPPPQTPEPSNSQNSVYGQNSGQNNGSNPPQAPEPGQVTVTPRQIAVTPENVTVEFDISASGPLNYIIVTLRAGDYQDVRQALMSTPQGRVPFLVPSEQARGGFIYEVKDEAQRVLASGSGDFRQIAKGN